MIAAVFGIVAASAVQLPDVTKGVINGRAAMVVMPRLAGKIIEPVKCLAHLVDHSKAREDTTADRRYPCGQWFQPPIGTYRLWLEQGDLITPAPDLLMWNDGPFTGRGLGDIVDVVIGGRVNITEGSGPADAVVRLIHTDSHTRLPFRGRVFERAVTAAEARQILMPAGRVIAVITDPRGNVLSLSRPVTVPERGTVVVEPPPTTSDVFVTLARPRVVSKAHPDPVTVALQVNDRSLSPNVFIDGADRLYAVWYDIDAPEATLTVTSTSLSLPDEQLPLRPSRISSRTRTLKILPGLRIGIWDSSHAFETSEKSVDIIDASRSVIRHLALTSVPVTAESLPAEHLRVALRIDKWRFARLVDLSTYEDAEVVFDLQPITVAGTVYRGDDPVRATLRFYIGPEWVDTSTNDSGHYEMTFWEPRVYPIEIQLRDHTGPPYREYFVEILASQTRDFRIPSTDYVVQLTDSRTRRPVPAGELAVLNTFTNAAGGEERASQKVIANDSGEARLQPLRPGFVTVTARAKGYFDSEPRVVPVPNDSAAHLISIELQPEDDATLLAVRLPRDLPASGAQLMAISADGSDSVLWTSSTDDDGIARIPTRLRGAIILIRHPLAAVLARLWMPSAEDSDAPTKWLLADRANTLVVTVADGNAERMPFADIVIWLDDILLRGNALRFLTETPPITNTDGVWRAENLPRGSLKILAMHPLRVPIAQQLASTIPFPWPAQVPIRVLQ